MLSGCPLAAGRRFVGSGEAGTGDGRRLAEGLGERPGDGLGGTLGGALTAGGGLDRAVDGSPSTADIAPTPPQHSSAKASAPPPIHNAAVRSDWRPAGGEVS
ncbi:MAG: hypothetical protein HKP61_08400 [Dactylosporangium sp.]|nr:hypothetical protein [Dactylosporangium sp.]NNJ60957.1 hypothetical protein [Dactylosporangium sp.]